MRQARILVVVEVRYRFHGNGLGALHSVGAAKQRRIIRTTQYYMQRRRRQPPEGIRFDVLAIQGSHKTPRVHWIRGAFDASQHL